MQSVDADGVTKRCPQCRRDSVMFTRHYLVLAITIAWTETGATIDDIGFNRRYEPAWVCQNPNCDYQDLVGTVRRTPARRTTKTQAPLTIGPTNDDVARRAYELYEARGGEHGAEVDDWLRAERELRGERDRGVNEAA